MTDAATATDPAGAGDDPVYRVEIFAVLFWGAMVVSLSRFGMDGFPGRGVWLLMLTAALAGLLLPRRRRVQCAAHALHLASFAAASPHYSNFHTVAALTSLGALACLGAATATPQRMVRFQTATVLMLATVYLFAAFIKLNTTFLDPRLSPVRAYLDLHPLFHAAGSWRERLVPIVIAGTLVAEFVVPACLLVPRLRLVGIALDVAMHAVFAFRLIPPSLNFPMLTLALCALWLPDEALARLRARRNAWAGQAALLALAALAALPRTTWVARETAGAWLTAAWVAVALSAARFLVTAFRACGRSGCTTFRMAVTPVTAALALLAALNGLAPYAGLRTLAAYEMFSGYLHAGGRSNHRLVPAGARLFRYTDRWVHLHETTHPRLRAYAERDLVISWTHLRRLAADGHHHSLAFCDNGTHRRLERMADDPGLARPLTAWERWIVNTMAFPRPRLAEVGLLSHAPDRPPRATDTLALSIP